MVPLNDLDFKSIDDVLGRVRAVSFEDIQTLRSIVKDENVADRMILFPNAFRIDESFHKSVYDFEGVFTDTFGSNFPVRSYRLFPNPLYIKVEKSGNIPYFMGSLTATLKNDCEVTDLKFIRIEDWVSSYVMSYDAINLRYHIKSCGILGAYMYQIATILQHEALCDSENLIYIKNRPEMFIEHYSQMKTIPTFMACWFLFTTIDVNSDPSLPDEITGPWLDRAEFPYFYEMGFLGEALSSLSHNLAPMLHADEIFESQLTGLKLFELYVRNDEGYRKSMLRSINKVLSGESGIGSFIECYLNDLVKIPLSECGFIKAMFDKPIDKFKNMNMSREIAKLA